MYKNGKIWDTIVQNRTLQPDFIILSDSKGNYTWQQLFDLVEKHTKHSVGKEPFLVFYSDKNVHSVAVILSCLMQNKTFIPVSREQPIERLKSILESLNHQSIYDPSTGSLIDFSVDNSIVNNSSFYQSMERSLYVLFTSGSTGTPKGVKITEANMNNTLEWGSKQFPWDINDIIGIVTSFHFDISLFDLFTGMIKGIRMHIFADILDPKKFCNEIFEFRVSSIFSTPSLFGLVANLNDPNLISGSNLRRIISGGDFFLPSDIIYWYVNFPNIEMYNVWGPTETTIVNTAHKITSTDIARLRDKKNIAIGQSTTEMPIVICEPDTYPINILTQPQEIGEIVVVGDSVGSGYLDPKIDSQKNFVLINGKPAYRTGDLGFIEDGKIYMIGRNVNLIKYQGYRIDPREIETIVLQLINIRNACLVLAENKNLRLELVLLIEVTKNSHTDISHIKSYLRERIPSYMIPKKVVFVESIPFSKNGKLDRKRCRLIAAEIGRLKVD